MAEGKKSSSYISVPVILITLCIIIITHACGSFYWAGEVSKTLEFVLETQRDMIDKIDENSSDRYTATDAKNDFRVVYQEISDVRLDYKNLNQKVTEFQAKYEATLNGSLR